MVDYITTWFIAEEKCSKDYFASSASTASVSTIAVVRWKIDARKHYRCVAAEKKRENSAKYHTLEEEKIARYSPVSLCTNMRVITTFLQIKKSRAMF